MIRSDGICRASNGARRCFAWGATHARRCPPQRDAAGTLFAAALAAAAKLLPALRFDVTGTCSHLAPAFAGCVFVRTPKGETMIYTLRLDRQALQVLGEALALAPM